MTFDTVLMTVAVVLVFLGFAGVLIWGDLQTRPVRLKTPSPSPRRRRSF